MRMIGVRFDGTSIALSHVVPHGAGRSGKHISILAR
jgi:hypothetical protein